MRAGTEQSVRECRLTSHIRLLFLYRSMCSGETRRPVKGPISVPALIQVLEKMPRPSPGTTENSKERVWVGLYRETSKPAEVYRSAYLGLSSERWSPHWVKPDWTASAPLDTNTACRYSCQHVSLLLLQLEFKNENRNDRAASNFLNTF